MCVCVYVLPVGRRVDGENVNLETERLKCNIRMRIYSDNDNWQTPSADKDPVISALCTV